MEITTNEIKNNQVNDETTKNTFTVRATTTDGRVFLFAAYSLAERAVAIANRLATFQLIKSVEIEQALVVGSLGALIVECQAAEPQKVEDAVVVETPATDVPAKPSRSKKETATV